MVAYTYKIDKELMADLQEHGGVNLGYDGKGNVLNVEVIADDKDEALRMLANAVMMCEGNIKIGGAQ